MSALEILTGALALITAYYAWQTHRIVREMRATRAAQVLPHLVTRIRHYPGGGGVLRILNAGLGPALNVDVVITLEPENRVDGKSPWFLPAKHTISSQKSEPGAKGCDWIG
jgi:hypothetical protein